MRPEPTSTFGSMWIQVIVPDACIGCNDCEISCPDFAIFVADKSQYKFAKLSEESKQRAQAIKDNKYRILSA